MLKKLLAWLVLALLALLCTYAFYPEQLDALYGWQRRLTGFVALGIAFAAAGAVSWALRTIVKG